MCVNHFHKNVEYFSILCYIEIKEVRKMLQLYKNIKKRRLELQLTQTDLATKLGYADKSMIAKIEKGLVDLPQSKILAFADELRKKSMINSRATYLNFMESIKNFLTYMENSLLRIRKEFLPIQEICL